MSRHIQLIQLDIIGQSRDPSEIAAGLRKFQIHDVFREAGTELIGGLQDRKAVFADNRQAKVANGGGIERLLSSKARAFEVGGAQRGQCDVDASRCRQVKREVVTVGIIVDADEV